MFLWLLPVAIFILLFAYGYYSARERIIIDYISQTTLLASSVGEQEINHFLQLRNSEFDLLNKSINRCFDTRPTDETMAVAALRYTTGFSALVMSDPLGKVTHTELSSNRSNRHVLTKSTLSRNILPEDDFLELKHRYVQWAESLSVLKRRERNVFSRLDVLKMRGEMNSQQYRYLQQQLFDLRERIDSPPTLVSLAGGKAADAIGLPFSADTFLFSKPILNCGGELKGFYTAYLDQTLLEDILYEIKQYFALNEIHKVDVALVNDAKNALITKVRFFSQEDAQYLESSGVPVLNGTLGGMYIMRTIKQSEILTMFSHEHKGIEKHDQREREWAANQSGISLLVFVSAKEIDERCRLVKVEVFFETILLMSVFLILIFFLSRHIVSPIVSLTSRAERLANGEHIPEKLTARNDEIGQLSHTFEMMANSIKTNERKLIDLATHDPLTGSLNRRALFAAAEEEKLRAMRSSALVTVCMLDLDHFKRINDDFGHKSGDEVLTQFCQRVQEILRAEDAMGRIGGEEFAVILPGADLKGGIETAERIRTQVLTIKIAADLEKNYQVSVSIGVSEWKADESFDEVLSRADEMLYKAKQSGRNRVEG
jgi:diguanylate cyclase (GGDEF)-like protein